ncbi:MAG: metallophosphoesterase family protein [Candidatus Micrarchaeia archaeon]
MKIAIVSDTHFGYERFAEDAYTQAKEALEKASEMADAILLPGDIFDKRFPRPDVLAQAFNVFRELSHKAFGAKVVSFESKYSKAFTNVPIIAISGTHERTALGKENPLNLLALAGLLIDASESTVTIEKEGEKASIFGLGGISEENVKAELEKLSPKPVEGSFNIFMFHQSVYELLPFSDDFIHFSDLPKGFDLYIDGHIHSKFVGNVDGKKFIIPGSTVLTQLKDNEQEQKGFFLFDTKTYEEQFIKIDSRPFKSLHITFKDAKPSDIEKRCIEEIDNAIKSTNDSKNRTPIIRVVMEGTIEKGSSMSDMMLNTIAKRYSSKAVLNIDASKLESPDIAMSIEGVRESKLSGMPIKDLGLSMLSGRLKELGFEGPNAIDLFNILSSQDSKEKVQKEALKYVGQQM